MLGMTKRIIVNQQDDIIGSKERADIDFLTDIYRVAALWLINLSGRVLIAQRGLSLKNAPGLWGPSVAGTLDEDAPTYEGCIVKETQEELGLMNMAFTKLDEPRLFNESARTYFVQYFTATIDLLEEDFRLDKREVNMVKWVDANMLSDDVKLYPEKYVDGFITAVGLLI